MGTCRLSRKEAIASDRKDRLPRLQTQVWVHFGKAEFRIAYDGASGWGRSPRAESRRQAFSTTSTYTCHPYLDLCLNDAAFYQSIFMSSVLEFGSPLVHKCSNTFVIVYPEVDVPSEPLNALERFGRNRPRLREGVRSFLEGRDCG
jgi:hypothetical protein